MNKFSITKILDSSKDLIQKRGPEIAIGFGIAGMITTTVLAVKATPKALMIIEEKKLDLDVEELKPVEVVKSVWPCYIPPIITGTLSIACLVGAASASARRNAAIATAYALSETTLKDYQSKVVEMMGEKKDREVRDNIAQDKLDKNPVSKNEVIFTNNGDSLCYEPLSGRYFKSDIEKIRRAINSINEQMIHNQYVSLNDFYEEIGLGTTSIGDSIGWSIDRGVIQTHFSSQLTDDNRPCLVIAFLDPPVYDYDKYL